jgi:hypothetical protein
MPAWGELTPGAEVDGGNAGKGQRGVNLGTSRRANRQQLASMRPFGLSISMAGAFPGNLRPGWRRGWDCRTGGSTAYPSHRRPARCAA